MGVDTRCPAKREWCERMAYVAMLAGLFGTANLYCLKATPDDSAPMYLRDASLRNTALVHTTYWPQCRSTHRSEGTVAWCGEACAVARRRFYFGSMLEPVAKRGCLLDGSFLDVQHCVAALHPVRRDLRARIPSLDLRLSRLRDRG